MISLRFYIIAALVIFTPSRCDGQAHFLSDDPGQKAANRGLPSRVRAIDAELQQATSDATTLLKVMLDSATPPATKVRAAECVLSHAQKAIELEDLEARLAELERSADFSSRETE